MRYLVLNPTEPLDPRKLVNNLRELHETFVPTIDCELEEDAVEVVRRVYSNAVAIPVPLTISGVTVVFLGIVSDISKAPSAPDEAIPFALLIEAVPESPFDQRCIFDTRHFTRKLWSHRVQGPDVVDGMQVVQQEVEVHATDLPDPVRTTAMVGMRDGRFVIKCNVGGVEMSLTFLDRTVLGLLVG